MQLLESMPYIIKKKASKNLKINMPFLLAKFIVDGLLLGAAYFMNHPNQKIMISNLLVNSVIYFRKTNLSQCIWLMEDQTLA